MLLIVLSFTAIAAMRVVQDVCGKKASNEVTPGVSFFRYGAYYNLLAALFSVIAFAIAGFKGFNLPTLLCAFLSAIFFTIDLFATIITMKGAPLTVCTIFSLGGLIVPTIGGVLMLNESVTYLQIIGLIIFLVGAYIHTQKGKKEGKSKKISLYTYILLVVRLLANGCVMFVQKYFSIKVVGGNVSTFSFLTFTLNCLIMLLCAIFLALKNKKKSLTTNESEEVLTPPTKTFCGLTKTLLICGGLLAFAVFVINFVVTELGKTLPSVILFPVSNAISIVVTALIGLLVFKEKLTVKSIIGLVVALAGIVFIGL